jgi:hypothetical protein
MTKTDVTFPKMKDYSLLTPINSLENLLFFFNRLLIYIFPPNDLLCHLIHISYLSLMHSKSFTYTKNVTLPYTFVAISLNYLVRFRSLI